MPAVATKPFAITVANAVKAVVAVATKNKPLLGFINQANPQTNEDFAYFTAIAIMSLWQL